MQVQAAVYEKGTSRREEAWPWCSGALYAQTLEWFEELVPDNDARGQMLGETAAALYGFSGTSDEITKWAIYRIPTAILRLPNVLDGRH